MKPLDPTKPYEPTYYEKLSAYDKDKFEALIELSNTHKNSAAMLETAMVELFTRVQALEIREQELLKRIAVLRGEDKC